MSTRKEILVNKDLWIQALTNTVQEYEELINTGESKDFDDCPLCKLSEQMVTHSWGLCKRCIHISPFGQGIMCANQTSFGNLQDCNYEDQPKWMRVRIKVLKNIIDKLNKS